MTLLLSAVLAASTVKSVGAVIAVLSVIAVVVYAVVNIRSGRDEVASEIELAANRKPYYDDETMEGPRLERALSMGLVLLARSEECRVGKECGSTCRSWWSPEH